MNTRVLAKSCSKLTRRLGRIGLALKRRSPEILTVLGCGGVGVALVMSCKQTLKAESVIEAAEEKLDKIEKVENGEIEVHEEYTEEDGRSDRRIVYSAAIKKLIKIYAVPAMVFILSIASIFAGNRVLRTRNLQLAAYAAGIKEAYDNYRQRTIAKYGEDVDRELRYGIKAEEYMVAETLPDGSEGVVKTVTRNAVGPDQPSEFARFFDSSCLGYTDDPELNLIFLKKQQSVANERLRSWGHLFVNEVYDMLGIQRTAAGNIAGWIYDEKNPIGDNYVDFGIYDDSFSKRNRAFVNGYEPVILLDFNVDGNILDKI